MCLKHTKLAKAIGLCSCSPPVCYGDIAIKPRKRTPLDCLGYSRKCCGCIPLKAAVLLISFLSFFWAAFELVTIDRFTTKMFLNHEQVLRYFKMIYIFGTVCLMIATGMLVLGTLVDTYNLVNFYVWYAFLYLSVYFVMAMFSVGVNVITTGTISKRQSVCTLFTVVWSCFFLYFLMVVNSFRYTIW
ncbi:uncharacterized protein LOC101740481 isoform X1 [Bombyx mori]|uniref:Uncharacterized protein n=1 Tax=Bombyx mori TaxID=7091 RepID=A0A8R2AJA7_BOMMO|nr:uncharacterized protein LOC101740481 isoform X1 [Bombyx mori]